MTNAEKYLKDGVNVEKFVEEIAHYVDKKYKEDYEWFHTVPLSRYLEDFFEIDLNKPIKPTLTEDERVILQGLKLMGIEKISRDKENDICFYYSSANRYGELGEKFANLNLYFQFIKERRRILY